MIKHSFVRSKIPKTSFTSFQPSPHKIYSTEQSLHRRRQSFDDRSKVRIQKHNTQNISGFHKYVQEESLEQSNILPEFNTKQNEINYLKKELTDLQKKISSSKALEDRLQAIEQRMSQSSISPQMNYYSSQIKSVSINASRGNNSYKVMDSDIQLSQPQSQQRDTIALRQMSKGIPVLKDSTNLCNLKQHLQQYIKINIQPLNKLESFQTSLLSLTQEINTIRKRQIHFLQLIQKQNQSHSQQLSSLKTVIKTQLQDYVKYQITKNNQLFFKLKNNDKNIIELVNKRIDDERQQTKQSNKQIQSIIYELRNQSNSKLQQVQKHLNKFKQQMSQLIHQSLDEFNHTIQQIKAQQNELATISGTLMQIIKNLVKKSNQQIKQQTKPLQLIDILKSNIIDINSLKIQQSSISQQLLHLKECNSISYNKKHMLDSLKSMIDKTYAP